MLLKDEEEGPESGRGSAQVRGGGGGWLLGMQETMSGNRAESSTDRDCPAHQTVTDPFAYRPLQFLMTTTNPDEPLTLPKTTLTTDTGKHSTDIETVFACLHVSLLRRLVAQ